MVDDQTLKKVVTTSCRTLKGAQGLMIHTTNKYIGQGKENMYYTSLVKTDMDVKLQIHDETHYLQIEKI